MRGFELILKAHIVEDLPSSFFNKIESSILLPHKVFVELQNCIQVVLTNHVGGSRRCQALLRNQKVQSWDDFLVRFVGTYNLRDESNTFIIMITFQVLQNTNTVVIYHLESVRTKMADFLNVQIL